MSNELLILKEVHNWIIENHLILWLDQGTLLGVIRDNKLIENDSDIDLSFLLKDAKLITNNLHKLQGFQIIFEPSEIHLFKNKVIVSFHGNQKLTKEPYYFNLYSTISTTSKIQTRCLQLFNICQFRNPVIGRIAKFEFNITKNSFIRYLLKKLSAKRLPSYGKTVFGFKTPIHFFDTLNIIHFNNMDWQIPFNTEQYLQFKYGSTWRTPDPKWDFMNDGAIVYMKLSLFSKPKNLMEFI